jgi:hypothetical protein
MHESHLAVTFLQVLQDTVLGEIGGNSDLTPRRALESGVRFLGLQKWPDVFHADDPDN